MTRLPAGRSVVAATVLSVALLLTSVPQAAAGTFAGRNGVIAFASAGDHGVEIYGVCPDGSRLRRFVATPEDTVTAYSDWSPDGRVLVFDSDRSGDVEIYLKGADGQVRRLTRSPSLTPTRRGRRTGSGSRSRATAAASNRSG